jgi:hypothetical protein
LQKRRQQRGFTWGGQPGRQKDTVETGALFRSERYDMWHNVAISQEAVKAFISDHYEKRD